MKINLSKDPSVARRYRANLQGEIDRAALYRTLASLETDSRIAEVYRRLAAVEDAYAEFWVRRLSALGVPSPPQRPGWRTRVLIWLARHWGTAVVLPIAGMLETCDRTHYDGQSETLGTAMSAQERSHARVLKALTHRPGAPGLEGGVLARLEGRHRGVGGNALRAAVLGANDGLVSNLSLVMGVAGAAVSSQTVLITGLAGLIAGACSMAMGEWLSVQSARELNQAQLATEADELTQAPDEEREELVLIYQAKGLDEGDARELANRVIAEPAMALDTLAREELGINPQELGGSPWVAAATSFLLFAVGALLPVMPFFVTDGRRAVVASALLSGAALFLLGAAITLFTGHNALYAGGRQVGIGLGAAALTYGIGSLLGVAVAG